MTHAMTDAVAIPLLLLGALTLAGTLEELVVDPLVRSAAPACCRRRVLSFRAQARWTLSGALLALLAGVALLLV